MTSTDFDHNDKLAVEKKVKLEWVTPKISLMDAGDAEAKPSPQLDERYADPGLGGAPVGAS